MSEELKSTHQLTEEQLQEKIENFYKNPTYLYQSEDLNEHSNYLWEFDRMKGIQGYTSGTDKDTTLAKTEDEIYKSKNLKNLEKLKEFTPGGYKHEIPRKEPIMGEKYSAESTEKEFESHLSMVFDQKFNSKNENKDKTPKTVGSSPASRFSNFGSSLLSFFKPQSQTRPTSQNLLEAASSSAPKPGQG